MPTMPTISPSIQAGDRRRKLIAVDFDGTLCVSKFPDIGEPNWSAINALKQRQMDGDIVILWTCREGHLLTDAVRWCKNHGLVFDAINENLPDKIKQYGNDPRKISADEYWDDHAVVVKAPYRR